MKLVLVLPAIGLCLASGVAFADDELYKAKNCFACHRIDRNHLAPTFKSIAAKYVDTGSTGDKGSADAKLAKKIREGSVGVWGPVPMPPQPQVTEAEALTLARWILELK
jgi:cytochrome c